MPDEILSELEKEESVKEPETFDDFIQQYDTEDIKEDNVEIFEYDI